MAHKGDVKKELVRSEEVRIKEEIPGDFKSIRRKPGRRHSKCYFPTCSEKKKKKAIREVTTQSTFYKDDYQEFRGFAEKRARRRKELKKRKEKEEKLSEGLPEGYPEVSPR